MMRRTHTILAVLFILIFIPYMEHKITFVFVTLLASLIPDIDTAYSAAGRFWGFRIFQIFVKHRGIIHSFSLCIVVSIVLSFLIPMLAFPFFLGYSAHLLLDSLTLEGIQPLWPLKKRASWFIRTNSGIEKGIFYSFIFVSILIFLFKYLF